jgi:hypothetical protein
MAAAAHTYKELLMKHGLSESVLDPLVQLLDRFDAAVSLAVSGRASHKAATKELQAVTTEIARTVRVMDARNRLRFQNDGQLLASGSARAPPCASRRNCPLRRTACPHLGTAPRRPAKVA